MLPSVKEFIPSHHPVQVVNEVLNKVDISKLEKEYKGGVQAIYTKRTTKSKCRNWLIGFCPRFKEKNQPKMRLKAFFFNYSNIKAVL